MHPNIKMRLKLEKHFGMSLREHKAFIDNQVCPMYFLELSVKEEGRGKGGREGGGVMHRIACVYDNFESSLLLEAPSHIAHSLVR